MNSDYPWRFMLLSKPPANGFCDELLRNYISQPGVVMPINLFRREPAAFTVFLLDNSAPPLGARESYVRASKGAAWSRVLVYGCWGLVKIS
jgi:hypothetical protein